MSGSNFAIDTTAAVAVMNREQAIAQVLGRHPHLFMPVTVLGELYFGAENSGRVAENVARVEYFRSAVTTLDIDAATAREYGRLDQLVRLAGTPLPQNDLWIIASALQHGLPVVSRDKHFSRVRGLRLITW